MAPPRLIVLGLMAAWGAAWSTQAAPEPAAADRSQAPVAQEASGAPETTDSRTGSPYRDRLIDPDVTPDPPADQLQIADESLPWAVGAAYRLGLRDDDGGELTEHGVSGHYQKDTANWGRIQLDVLARSADAEAAGPDLPVRSRSAGSDAHFTLTQTGLPLASGWLADSGLGVQRSAGDELVSSSYRMHLPTSILNGFTTRIGDGDREYRFTWGEVGRVEGLFSRTFQSEDTNLLGAGFSRGLGEGWRVGADFWHVDGTTARQDENSLAAALAYVTPEEDRSDQFHLLADDGSDAGIWYDGYRAAGRWEHRFGAFSLAPDLSWQNTVVSDDRDGAYYRLDYRRLSASYNLGLDFNRARSTDRSDYRLFAGARWRLAVDRSVGAQGSFGALDPSSALLPPGERAQSRRDWQLTTFYSETYEHFDSRVELGAVDLEGPEDERRYQLSLDQFWLAPALDGLTTRLELERRDLESEELNQIRAGFTYRRQFAGGVSLDTGVLLVAQEQPGGRDTEGANVNVNLNWPFHRDWSLNVNATYNRTAVADPLPSSRDETLRGNQLFVSLSYGRSGGRLPGVVGAGSAERGIGRVTGYVFFDENRDGRRSPGERGAEGLVVRLDGVVTTVSDAQGRFEFWPVAAGTHRLEISVESVPLPWEPVRRMDVTVQPRGETYHDLPLQRIDE